MAKFSRLVNSECIKYPPLLAFWVFVVDLDQKKKCSCIYYIHTVVNNSTYCGKESLVFYGGVTVMEENPYYKRYLIWRESRNECVCPAILSKAVSFNSYRQKRLRDRFKT